MSGMDMSSMDSSFAPGDQEFAKYFWYAVAAVIATAGVVNVAHHAICFQRLRASRRGDVAPSRPRNFVLKSWATITAITRECSYPQWLPSKSFPQLHLPPLSNLYIILAYLVLVVSVTFAKVWVSGSYKWESVAYRAAWISVAQLPLLFILAGKNNPIGWITGTSHERLNYIHRWAARGLLLTSTVHWGYFITEWNHYGVTKQQFKNYPMAKSGFAAWGILLWIVLSSFAPIRGWRYEFFVLQHIASAVAFLVMVYVHIPATARAYLWVPVAFWAFDRTVRTVMIGWRSLRLRTIQRGGSGEEKSCCSSSEKEEKDCCGKAVAIDEKSCCSKDKSITSSKTLLGNQAMIEALPGHTTRVTIEAPTLSSWTPGQHLFLRIPSLGLVDATQSHPFTIASIPSDKKLTFLIKGKRGFSGRLWKCAAEMLPPANERKMGAIIDGPYGVSPMVWAYDTVVLVAGASGVTFTLPILMDLVERARKGRDFSAVRRLHFIWVIKAYAHTAWCAEELGKIRLLVQEKGFRGLEVKIDIHVTCDETFTANAELGNFGADGVAGLKTTCADGKCCCATSRSSSDDEIEVIGVNTGCNCNCTVPPPPSSSTGSTPLLPAFSGRPALKKLLKEDLEQAFGETGVVVCGPTALGAMMRNTVISLSDERAVHKGTGAQGIYLHVESFRW
ncbi:hypothetical protein G7K_1978-t1 [Saitoella complicata NRRL Y-17804]|uniref:ferric-chelate reductase (NADPH) n=1 Tax=Saitoella complicata (strain BCRC 22490 / CBS 7301 / JCM 7358 / NBRC 10748 / NRRL Y-17804) TaxID=698492 RepID=A0A0E9NEE0_SAICN|nr:hypothetical protein G7K_1978-t1 [Saitoella complicata NRRL Y-17804]